MIQPAKAIVKFNIPQAVKEVSNNFQKGQALAGAFLSSQIKKAISIPGDTRGARRLLRNMAKRGQIDKLNKAFQKGVGRSSTGTEYPHKITGQLRSSIGFEIRGKDLNIGSISASPASAYAARLEFGFMGDDSKGRRIHQLGRYYAKGTVLKNRAKALKIMAMAGKAI